MSISTAYTVTIPAGAGPIGLVFNENQQRRTEIIKVDAASRAAACKIIPNSVIISVNGTDTAQLTSLVFQQLLKPPAGQALVLTLEPPGSGPSSPPSSSSVPRTQTTNDEEDDENNNNNNNNNNDDGEEGEGKEDINNTNNSNNNNNISSTSSLSRPPSDWGMFFHHQFSPVSTQVENGLHALKRVLQHIEKATSLHSSLAKARKTVTVVKPMETEVETSKFFAEAYVFGQDLNLHATECMYAFSMSVSEQIIHPGMKFYQTNIDMKREIDKQMKKREELYQKLTVASKKDLLVCKNDLALLITASDEKKAVEGKKFTELTTEQQKTYNKLDANKAKAQAKAVKQLKEYHANFIKARQAQEDRNSYVRYALNVLRNIERERMETSTIYLYRLNELYTTFILELQKLSLAEKLANLDTTKTLESCKEMWEKTFGPPPEDILLDYGLPCSPEEAEKDIFKSNFCEEMNKAKYTKEEYKEVNNDTVTASGKLIEEHANALAMSKTHTNEQYDEVRDELGLRQKPEIVNLLRKHGDNLPFLEQTHLSQTITRISARGKKDVRIFLLTDKAIYSLNEKLNLQRRIGFENIYAVTVSNNSNELRIHVKKNGGVDLHIATEKKQLIADALHLFLPQFYRIFPDLDAQFKKQQFFFYVDVQNLLRFRPDQTMRVPSSNSGSSSGSSGSGSSSGSSGSNSNSSSSGSSNITAGDEVSLTYTGEKGEKGVHAKDFKASGLLGQGTFGRVLLVNKNDDNKQYAMKILNKKFLVTNDQVKNVKNEQQILTQIDFPFVVRAHYTFTGHERIYMVLDYAAGGELYHHIKKMEKFSEEQAKFIVAEISLALGHLHSKNIIYRDLKPENVLLDEKGHVKITDFGTAKTLEAGGRTHTFCGTPQYLSPEVVLGYGHDKAVDWWALGILLYELTIGVAPFSDDNTKKLHDKIQNGVLKFPSSMSNSCKDLIVSLLNRSAKHRLGSTDDVNDIKKHEFFKNFEWDKLLEKKLTPPFVPPLIKPIPLTKAQQKEFRDEQTNSSMLTLVPGYKNRATKKQAEIDANFRGFTWAANSMEEYAENSAKLPRRPGDIESALDALEEEGDGSSGGNDEKENNSMSAAEKEKAIALRNKVAQKLNSQSAATLEPKKAPPPPSSSSGTLKPSDKAAADKAAADKAAADKVAADKAAADKERAEKEQTERVEKERVEKERAEKERAEKERAEKERAEKERAEKERAEKERAEKERADKLATEKEAAELAAAEAEIQAAEAALAAAQAKKAASVLPIWEVTHKGGLRVRAEPSKEGAEAGTLSFGQKVSIISQQGDWVQHSAGWCLTKTPQGKALMEPVSS